ncbi:sensor histidine kinase [Micromonospora sp. NBC_01796]|uniref:sensor histidine kinase n=1 Tax=Micromonospora sp. NBC_01796 TaxID=2975987 RepID=UPI002DD828F6|nr:histidine kinase [Micromonospora sp. NBC_01796]WSA89561.1 histidine kinase [Micromonospora sp. NBC_01796]
MRTGRWRWGPDLLLGLVGLALVAANGLLGWAEIQDNPVVAGLATATGLALFGARRWPWPTMAVEATLLVVADAVAPPNSVITQLGLAVALAVVGYRSRWLGTTAAFLLALVATLIDVVDPGGEPLGLTDKEATVRVLAIAALVGAPIVFGRYLRRQRDATLVAEERVWEAETRQAAENRAARLAERTSIARDLHDIVAHHVSAIALQAGAAQFAARHTGRVDDAVVALGEVRGTAGRVLDELRELLEVLRDPEAVEATTVLVEPEQIFRDAVRQVEAGGLEVRLAGAELVAGAPLVVRTTAARVIQEGLTNALKHAGPGSSVSVRLCREDRGLLVEVLDSGSVRADPVRTALPPSGHGLAGMRERVGLLGGRLAAGPAADGGWRLTAHLPVKETP